VGVLPYFQVICRQVSREDWDRANESAKANMNDYLSIVGHSMDTFTADDLQELLAP
jgi:S-formylglutathione hydrolase FrmB